MKKIYKFLKGLILKEKPEFDWDRLIKNNPEFAEAVENLRMVFLEYGFSAEDLEPIELE